jgi:hypothetical protein
MPAVAASVARRRTRISLPVRLRNDCRSFGVPADHHWTPLITIPMLAMSASVQTPTAGPANIEVTHPGPFCLLWSDALVGCRSNERSPHGTALYVPFH